MPKRGSKRVKSESVVFNGIEFKRYPEAKQPSHRWYFTPSQTHCGNGVQSLHREIWKSHHGPIPKGMHIHHKDGNPLNNSIDNLACVTEQEHSELHREDISKRLKGKRLPEKALAKAAEWHKSDEGRNWHSQHAKKVADGIEPKECTCKLCGVTFLSKHPHKATYCGSKCRQRQYAIDNGTQLRFHDLQCKECGNGFRSKKRCAKFCTSRCKQRFRNRKHLPG